MSFIDSLLMVLSEIFGDVILYSAVKSGPEHRLGLGALVVMGFLVVYFTRKARAGSKSVLRPLPGLSDIDSQIQRAIEKGQKVHASVGVGSLSDVTAIQTLAGIDALNHISRRAIAMGADFTATTASPTTLPSVSTAVRAGYEEIDSPETVGPENVRLVAPQPIPYAIGVSRLLKNENVGYNAMIGYFGDEYLLMGETGAQKGIYQLVATANPTVIPFAIMTASQPLIGEELFAMGAYLNGSNPRIGSLVTQDLIRITLIAAIIGGSVIASLLRIFVR